MAEGRGSWRDVADEQLRELLAHRRSRRLLDRAPAIVAIDLYELAYAGGSRWDRLEGKSR